MTLLLSNEEIDAMLDVSMVFDAVEPSQIAMASGRALSGPRVDTLAPTTHGEAPATYGLKAMSGLWPEAGVAALRINSDVLVWPTVAGNVRRDRLPTNTGRWTGMIVLHSMTRRTVDDFPGRLHLAPARRRHQRTRGAVSGT